MNKTFMLLNDNTIEITNEYEQEINRGEFENNNVKGILLAENKVEIIKCFKKGFDMALLENQKVLKLSNYMLKLQPFIIVVVPALSFLFNLSSNLNLLLINGNSNAISGIAGLIIPVVISSIYWSITRMQYKKKIKEIHALIDKTEEIKKDSEEELTKEKNKTISNTLELLVKVSLEEENNTIKEHLLDELINYRNEYINESRKIKIRKR